MEEINKQDRITGLKVREMFDETLGNHLERLIGTRYGIGALPLNLAAISYLILLAERETEIDNFPSSPPDRYTHETLLKELEEIGLSIDEDLTMVLEYMIEKDYIDVADDGKFSSNRATISMAQLLDTVFPGMPGINLIAYFIQTIDEVQSGRQDMESGISQLDQLLRIHGVPLKTEKSRTAKEKVSGPSDGRQIVRKKTIKASDTFSHLQRETHPKDSSAPSSGPKIMSSTGNLRRSEIRDLFSRQDDSVELTPEIDEPIEAQKQDNREGEKEQTSGEEVESEDLTAGHGLPPEPVSVIPKETGSETEDLTREPFSTEAVFEDSPATREVNLPPSVLVEQKADFSEDTDLEHEQVKSDRSEEALPTVGPKIESEILSEDVAAEGIDDVIEKQISDFEQDLSMQCPICRTGKVQTEGTSTGKVYYKCSNIDCNFISWGKPYHMACPLCNNPFLVETSQRDGKSILKCPRATCRHWQQLPWETVSQPLVKSVSDSQEQVTSTAVSRKSRRKVRRRVVRRKR